MVGDSGGTRRLQANYAQHYPRVHFLYIDVWYNICMTKDSEPEEEYSGFKTLGTDIDEAYSETWELDADVDDILEDDYSDDE